MLIKDLYSYIVTSHSENQIEAEITVNEKSSIYSGHFPERAITPGVCQVHMIKQILIEELNSELQLTRAKNIKFITIHMMNNFSF